VELVIFVIFNNNLVISYLEYFSLIFFFNAFCFLQIDSVAVNISNLVLENQPPRISKAQKRRVRKSCHQVQKLVLCVQYYLRCSPRRE
jgi:hypothetical protein